jgi:hypothetical protein
VGAIGLDKDPAQLAAARFAEGYADQNERDYERMSR